MKIVFVASAIRNSLCIIYVLFIIFFKNHLLLKIIFWLLQSIWLPRVHCILVLLLLVMVKLLIVINLADISWKQYWGNIKYKNIKIYFGFKKWYMLQRGCPLFSVYYRGISMRIYPWYHLFLGEKSAQASQLKADFILGWSFLRWSYHIVNISTYYLK